MRKIPESPNFEKMLRQGELFVPPLQLRVTSCQRRNGEDAIVNVTWRGKSCRYVAELKRDAKPQTLRLAIDQVKSYARKSAGAPMVIAPYFSGDKLDELLKEGVSGLDFCGNAAIEAPGKFLFYKTGNPNRFPDSSPIRSAYRGDSSLVARALLLQMRFESVSEILTAIKQRGGSLTMGTVSKTLRRLESDLVVERPSRSTVRLIQHERLLDELLEAYQPPQVESTWTGKVKLAATALIDALSRADDVVRTGESSAGEFAAWAGEPMITCYCRSAPTKLLSSLKMEAAETSTFPNLRLLQTEDQLAYFDRRPRVCASPVQSWLEMASGDKRQKEVAEQIRAAILSSVKITP